MATVDRLNYRMFPPAGAKAALTFNGRTYTGTPGTPATVPDFDGRMLEANGWVLIAISGPTSSRPIDNVNSPYRVSPGLQFYDETLSKLIVWAPEGAWRDLDGTAV